MPRKEGVVEGNDLMLYVNTAAAGSSTPTWEATAHATSHSIAFSVGTKERKTKTTGKWSKLIVTGNSCEIKCEALVAYKDGYGYSDLKKLHKAGTPVMLKFAHVELAAQDEYEEGEFLITNIDESSGAGEDATYSATFKNHGEVVTKTQPAASGQSEQADGDQSADAPQSRSKK